VADRVTTDDLWLAATWLTEYADGDDTDPQRAQMLRVSRWLAREASRRERASNVTAVVAGAGGDPKNAKQRAAATRILTNIHNARLEDHRG